MVRTCETFKISSRNLNFKNIHIIIPQSFKIKNTKWTFPRSNNFLAILSKISRTQLKAFNNEQLSTFKGHSLY